MSTAAPTRALSRSRLEDVQWMVATGESFVGAARRLGISEAAFEKWCSRHAPDAGRRLHARDPISLNSNNWTGANQYQSGAA